MTLNGGTLGFDVMDQLMARVHELGWHANIQLDGRELPRHAAQIQRLAGRFVIDHTGKVILPPTHDFIGHYNNGRAIFAQRDRFGGGLTVVACFPQRRGARFAHGRCSKSGRGGGARR